MIGTSQLARVLASTLVLGLAGAVAQAHGNRPPSTNGPDPVIETAAAAVGEIRGIVTDAKGAPLAGTMISALGAGRVAFAVCDADGRFEFPSLPAGPYLLGAHLKGFAASRRGLVEVGPNRQTIHSFTLQRSSDAAEAAVPPTLAAGFVSRANQPSPPGVELTGEPAETTPALPPHDHTEKTWRLRHLRRSVLKEVTPGVDILNAGVTDGSSFPWGARSLLSRAAASSGHLAGMLLDGVPFSGQFSLVTTSMFGQSAELPMGVAGARGGAYVDIGAPAAGGDWSVRSAITNGDVSTLLLAGSYRADPRASHALDVGMSYGVQRYEGGHPAAVGTFVADNRNVKSVHVFDEWSLSSKLAVDYGARFVMYDDYGDVEGTALFSPRLRLTVSPADRTYFRAAISQRMVAPGSEQFLPPPADRPWLPPARAFAPLSLDGRLAERARHLEFVVERELSEAYVVGVRRFYQGVDDQLVTLFGVSVPNGMRSGLGHYYLASAGGVNVDGWAVTLSRMLPGRLRGWVDYSVTKARWSGPETTPLPGWPQSTRRPQVEEFHDLTTSVETEIPETATRVRVRCRMNTAYAQSEADVIGPGLDARFDIQVKQALPFLAFDHSSWEVLVAVRSLLREPWDVASVYDELLVVRPPKQIVSGLIVRF